MAGEKNKGQAAETPDSVETQSNAGKPPAQGEAGQPQAKKDDQSAMLLAYQSLAGSAATLGELVRTALDAKNTESRVLLLDDWNYLKSSALVVKVDAALAYYASSLAHSEKAINESLASAGEAKTTPKAVTGEAGEQRDAQKESEATPADFGSILGDLKNLHEWLQPTIKYAAQDLNFDADTVRSAVAGALAQPPAKLKVFIPSLRQIDPAAGLPLLRRLQEAVGKRDALAQKLAAAGKWIEDHADSPKKPAVESAMKAGDAVAKAFDAYLESLLKIEPPVLEQALMHQAAGEIDATHLLAVKPVWAVSQTMEVRAFPLLIENKHLGAAVLAYTLTAKDGQVIAGGIADAEKTRTVEPHPADKGLAWLLRVVVLLLAFFLVLAACTLSFTGLRAFLTAVNPPISAPAGPTATPMPAALPSATPPATPGR